MKMLITGASSYVGAGIYVYLRKRFDVIGTYLSNKLFPELELLDIRSKVDVDKYIHFSRPDIIVHVAANASGSWCEKNPEQAIAINLDGTKNIIDAANLYESKVVFISSMAVANFDSIYGKTKIESEGYVKNTRAGYVILRPSLIVGLSPNTSNDRPFNRFLKNIRENSPAIYDTSWKFQPTWLRHLSEVVGVIIEKNILNEVIPICVSEIKTRFEIANDLLPEFNVEVVPEDQKDTNPTFSVDLNKLKELKLPVYTYRQMIDGVREEIKNYLND